ncbi:MAG: Ni/Fe hydrogenase subunit alpha [Candidatus Xenobiia bacterium LiM19]
MKTITIDPVTRIEGHAKIKIDLDDSNKVTSAIFQVIELRGFEKIMVGMEIEKLPLFTARICGVCPTAHHLASAKTLDKVFEVEPPPAGKLLRELMYMGHIIHSHALHFFVLGGPDLILGIDSPAETRNILGVLQANPDAAKKALRLRSIGQMITEIIGGRGVHPVTCVAGGITFKMSDERRQQLKSLCSEALEIGKAVLPLCKQIVESHTDLVNDLSLECYYLGTMLDGKVNFINGDIRAIDPKGNKVAEFPIADYKKHIVENVFPYSYMKPVYFKHNGGEHVYMTNPLARLNCADAMETPLAEAEFKEFRQRFGRPAHHAALSHYARIIELVYAIEKANQLIDDDTIMGEPRVPVTKKPGRGVGHVEAPRGILIHEYESDERGRVKMANLIVATQQNYAAINESIRQAAVKFIEKSDKQVLNGVEVAVRCYDPCLSCATHAIGHMAMDVEIFKNGEIQRKIRRSIE